MALSLIKQLTRLSFGVAFWALNTNRGDLSQDAKECIDVCAMDRIKVSRCYFGHLNHCLG